MPFIFVYMYSSPIWKCHIVWLLCFLLMCIFISYDRSYTTLDFGSKWRINRYIIPIINPKLAFQIFLQGMPFYPFVYSFCSGGVYFLQLFFLPVEILFTYTNEGTFSEIRFCTSSGVTNPPTLVFIELLACASCISFPAPSLQSTVHRGGLGQHIFIPLVLETCAWSMCWRANVPCKGAMRGV